MGNLCVPAQKQTQAHHPQLKAGGQLNTTGRSTLATSQIMVNSESEPDVFRKIELTFENQKIIQTFYQLKNQYKIGPLTQSYIGCRWKQINLPFLKGDEIYGICQWKSAQDKTMTGPGLICCIKKENQILIGAQFQNGKVNRSKKGFKIFRNCSYYIGEFDSQLTPHGQGELHVKKDQYYYKGSFLKGVPHGKGEKVYPDRSFKGEFKNGQIIRGKQVTQRGQYEGPFKNNHRHGRGLLKMNSGLSFEGQFEDGKKSGSGILKDLNGIVIASGMWKNDKKIDQNK